MKPPSLRFFPHLLKSLLRELLTDCFQRCNQIRNLTVTERLTLGFFQAILSETVFSFSLLYSVPDYRGCWLKFSRQIFHTSTCTNKLDHLSAEFS